MNTLINSLLLINTSSWIFDNRNLLYDKSIYEISIPGTHDSGSYNINGSFYIDMPEKYNDLIYLAKILNIPITNLIKGWAQTQNKNVYSQLQEGARYLDLRIGYKYNKWYMHHDYILGYSLENILSQVRNFIIENQGEIIMIELSHIFNLSDKNIIELNKTIINYIGEFMYKERNLKNITIGQLVGMGMRILVFTDTILYIPTNNIFNTWANTPDVKEMNKYNDKMMVLWENNKKKNLFKLSWVLTPNTSTFLDSIVPNLPNNLRNLEKNLGSNLDYWSKKYIDRIPLKYPVFPNIIIVDFIEDTRILDIIIDCLRKT